MPQRDRIDLAGALALVGFSALLGFNQVVIRVVNEGLQPVFFAALRSAGAVICLAAWFHFRGRAFGLARADLGAGLMMGTLFATEFILLFVALDLTTVSRASVMFYTMPLWLALLAHWLIPGERITKFKAAGQFLAFSGVAIAILWRAEGGGASLVGDLLALLAAVAWAGLAVVARTGGRSHRTVNCSGRWRFRPPFCLSPRRFSAPSYAICNQFILLVWDSRSLSS